MVGRRPAFLVAGLPGHPILGLVDGNAPGGQTLYSEVGGGLDHHHCRIAAAVGQLAQVTLYQDCHVEDSHSIR